MLCTCLQYDDRRGPKDDTLRMTQNIKVNSLISTFPDFMEPSIQTRNLEVLNQGLGLLTMMIAMF